MEVVCLIVGMFWWILKAIMTLAALLAVLAVYGWIGDLLSPKCPKCQCRMMGWGGDYGPTYYWCPPCDAALEQHMRELQEIEELNCHD
jgi:hypothetical protein